MIAAPRRLLAPYGGHGAYAASGSSRTGSLSDEIAPELAPWAILVPASSWPSPHSCPRVLGRLVAGQREQIAALKAFGYANGALAATTSCGAGRVWPAASWARRWAGLGTG